MNVQHHPCCFCEQEAITIDNDGYSVCEKHDDAPRYKELPGAMPGSCYRYLGRTRTRERILVNWPNLHPLVTVYEDGFFYTFQLLPRIAPMRSR